MLDAQRAATLGKIQKVKEELNLTTTTQKRRGDVGGSIAEEKEEEAKAKEAAAVAASSRKRRDEGEAERAKGGGKIRSREGIRKRRKEVRKGRSERRERKSGEGLSLIITTMTTITKKSESMNGLAMGNTPALFIEGISSAFRERDEGVRGYKR